MNYTNAQVAEQLKTLLPPGPLFNGNSVSDGFWLGIAQPFTDLLNTLNVLIEEANPLSTNELLPMREQEAGLSSVGFTVQQRLNNLITVWRSTGGQSISYFTTLAQSLGYTITITEFRPFLVGSSCVGDSLYNGNDWAYTWQINVGSSQTYYFSVGSSVVGDPLASWSNVFFETLFNKIKPAETTLIFTYS